MNIGIVNMTGFPEGTKYIIKCITKLGYIPNNIEYTTEDDIFKKIALSKIKHWIFSGSPHMVVDTTSPIVSLNILNLTDKKFMLICYSMESVLYQLGFPVIKRYKNKKEKFRLKLDVKKIEEINKTNILYNLQKKPGLKRQRKRLFRLRLKRNHHYYIPSDQEDVSFKKHPNLHLVSSYRNESMMIFYKNSILVQFHPERTSDGYKLINNWIMLL
jgi:GMP synthase-like glutamine amidotransferase